MKKIFLLLLFDLCLLSAGARKVEHPMLLYTPERIQEVKERIVHNPDWENGWNSLLQTADNQLAKGEFKYIDYLSLAYLMTGEEKYADKVKSLLLEIIKTGSYSSGEMLARLPAWRADLGVAHKAYLSAIAFDAIYNVLTSSERKEIAEGLNRLFLEPCLGDWLMEPTRIHSLNSMGHNWWTSCVCMGGILALSLQNELPEAALGAEAVYEALPQWFNFAGDVLQHKPKSFDRNGGMYESLSYANFGLQEALQFLLAWKYTHPGEKMVDIPQLEKLPDYFMHVCYPRTGILYNLNFGDSHKNVAAEATMMLLYAMGIRNDNMLWYINQVKQGQHRDGYFLNRPMGLLYTPDVKRAPEVAQAEHSRLFPDFGWAVMRDSWEKDATLLAVKSGFTWNHAHADANSFILYHKGVDIIKDAGNCWYPNPEYRNYFFQSQAHNVVLFNGKGQPKVQQYQGSPISGELHSLLDGGNIKYLLADGTGPYADRFSRNFRHFLWLDNVIYVIDDLKTYEAGNFQWLWHPGGKAHKQGVDFDIVNGKSAVVLRPLYPRLLALSDFVHDYPEDLYWEEIEAPTEDLKGREKYYSFHLPGETDRLKGVTAFILKDSVGQKELPQMERREGKDWIGLRIRYKGKVTDLYINQLADGRLMHSNSWIEADGWQTDAYMFAVSYDENDAATDAEDLFVCYGSALRRGSDSYFSSLTKLSFIQKQGKEGMRVWMDGQPVMYATFRSGKCPRSLQVNGDNVPVTFLGHHVKVKCVIKK